MAGSLHRLAEELLSELNPIRRLRTVTRQLKRRWVRMPGWHPDRPPPPQPTKLPANAILIIAAVLAPGPAP